MLVFFPSVGKAFLCMSQCCGHSGRSRVLLQILCHTQWPHPTWWPQFPYPWTFDAQWSKKRLWLATISFSNVVVKCPPIKRLGPSCCGKISGKISASFTWLSPLACLFVVFSWLYLLVAFAGGPMNFPTNESYPYILHRTNSVKGLFSKTFVGSSKFQRYAGKFFGRHSEPRRSTCSVACLLICHVCNWCFSCPFVLMTFMLRLNLSHWFPLWRNIDAWFDP